MLTETSLLAAAARDPYVPRRRRDLRRDFVVRLGRSVVALVAHGAFFS